MKKFISMVMAAAMVVSLVPATAFAVSVENATAKVVDKHNVTVADADETIADVELQLVLNGVEAKATKDSESLTFTLKLDKAKYDEALLGGTGVAGEVVRPSSDDEVIGSVTWSNINADLNEVDMTITELGAANFANGDVVCIGLAGMTFTKDTVGTKATVKATGDVKSDAVVFAEIVDKGLDVELDDDVVDVAPEEFVTIEKIVIAPTVGDTFASVLKKGDEISFKLNKGFEFIESDLVYTAKNGSPIGPVEEWEDDKLTIKVGDGILAADEITIEGFVVEATTADAGDVCVMTVKGAGLDSDKVEVAQVVDMKVVMSLVDADEDVPTFYNGVNVANTGLTVDDDHKSLEVSIKETFAGAWSNHKDWTLTLPEGVHVVDVVAADENGTWADIQADFATAYQNDDHESFKFKKRSFTETTPNGDAHEITFVMTLVAEPDFVGDVTLTLEGAAVDTQEVVIAKVLAPYTVEATQNDVIIDYRYTEVPTAIVIKEAEAGLWAKGLTVTFDVEDNATDLIDFEDDATVTVNEESEMEIDDEVAADGLGFKVEDESEEEAAVITIDGIELFMQRNIPAGPYALEVSSSAVATFLAEGLFAPDRTAHTAADHECVVADVDDFSSTVHESWINVITAGRDKDDASFTKKVVVPVGESYIIAGEETVALDVPAYINADGYTMLPVRAVATALGINNNNVIWSQAAKQVTILYGQRIITMTAGEAVVYVNASSIPASAAVEIVDGRAFLALRDLANALGVTEIAYDAATKTATLN